MAKFVNVHSATRKINLNERSNLYSAALTGFSNSMTGRAGGRILGNYVGTYSVRLSLTFI